MDIFKPDLEKWRPAGVECEQQRWLKMNESHKNGGKIKSENSPLIFFYFKNGGRVYLDVDIWIFVCTFIYLIT